MRDVLINIIGSIIVAVIGMYGTIKAARIANPNIPNPGGPGEQNPGESEGQTWSGRLRSWVGRGWRALRRLRPTQPNLARRILIMVAFVAFFALGVSNVIRLVDNLSKVCSTRTPLTIMVSAEKDLLLKDLADEYDGTRRTCSNISVVELTSGAALEDLSSKDQPDPLPHVWMPSSSMWVDLLRARNDAPIEPVGKVESVAQSPLVIAMPEKVASAFGWNQRTFGWQEVLGYARDPESWEQKRLRNPGLTERFFLAKENPERSTSAFAATVASYYAAASQHHKPGKLTVDHVRDRQITNDVRNVESSMQYRLDDVMDLLKNLGEEDGEGQASSYLSGVIMQEELSYLYNSGDPEVSQKQPPSPRQEPLRVFYPRDGTVVMDHPYTLLSTMNSAQGKVARDFRDFLRDTDRQDRFRQKGFRGHDGRMFSDKVAKQAGLPDNRSGTPFLPKPDTEALRTIHENVGSLRRSARVLLLIDRSGSMGSPDQGAFKTGLEIVKEQLQDKLIDQLGDNDELTVWSFADNYRKEFSATPGKDLKENKSKQEFDDKISGIASGGNTALHDTVLAAVRELRKESSGRDGLTPTIILLSDGYDTRKSLTLDQLRKRLADEAEETPVPRVYTIGYGVIDPDKDANALKDISIATKGKYYDAKKERVDLDRVFNEVFGHL
ncbi:substrate-binding domain-containing protein [Actinomadura sp. 9N407]|uniref:substrate-binding and vWA domain-containing protein n=1 Tax=Actinomadura sp. 9N407 TaxID=3375154 RepID=UPI0037AC3535